jgi:hypothetical protein
MRERRTGVAAAVAALFLLIASPSPAAPGDPGKLPQTAALPSAVSAPFRARMRLLWRAIVADEPAAAGAAFFPESAYARVKAISDPDSDYRARLLAYFAADVHAAHRLLAQGGPARLLYVAVPHEWAWIAPGGCYNRVGYWHAPGSRLVYRQDGQVRSFGVYSLISWRGQWYVVHLGRWNQPGTVVDPESGVGEYGPPGGC